MWPEPEAFELLLHRVEDKASAWYAVHAGPCAFPDSSRFCLQQLINEQKLSQTFEINFS